MVQPLKVSGTMLAINGRYSTTKYNSNIKEAITSIEHRRYFIEQYKKKGLIKEGYISIA